MAESMLAVRGEKRSRQKEIDALRKQIEDRKKSLLAARNQIEADADSTTDGMHTPVHMPRTPGSCHSMEAGTPGRGHSDAEQEQGLMQQLRTVRSRMALEDLADGAQSISSTLSPTSSAAPAARCSGVGAKGNSKGHAATKAEPTEEDYQPAEEHASVDENRQVEKPTQGLAETARPAASEELPNVNTGKRGGVIKKHQNVEDMNRKCLLARVRRVCEMKETGKCRVSDDVHKLWKSYTDEQRMRLAEILAASDWQDKVFETRITATYLRQSDRYVRQLKGYFTAKQMVDELKYDAAYVKKVVKYCTDRKLYRNTKYDRKTREFWVEHSARHESVELESHSVSKVDNTQGQSDAGVSGVSEDTMPYMPPAVPDPAEESDDDDEHDEGDKNKAGSRKTGRRKKHGQDNANVQPADDSVEDHPYSIALLGGWPTRLSSQSLHVV